MGLFCGDIGLFCVHSIPAVSLAPESICQWGTVSAKMWGSFAGMWDFFVDIRLFWGTEGSFAEWWIFFESQTALLLKCGALGVFLSLGASLAEYKDFFCGDSGLFGRHVGFFCKRTLRVTKEEKEPYVLLLQKNPTFYNEEKEPYVLHQVFIKSCLSVGKALLLMRSLWRRCRALLRRFTGLLRKCRALLCCGEAAHADTCSNTHRHSVCPHATTHSNTLQHTETHCKSLQHTATHTPCCNSLQHTATRCNTLQRTAIYCNNVATHSPSLLLCWTSARCCNTLQHTASHCNALQHTATMWPHTAPAYCYATSARHDLSLGSLQHTATHCNTLQHTATHCNTHTHTHCNNVASMLHRHAMTYKWGS